MTRQFLTGAGLLIGGYLALAYYTGFGKDIAAVGSVGTSFARTLQGR